MNKKKPLHSPIPNQVLPTKASDFGFPGSSTVGIFKKHINLSKVYHNNVLRSIDIIINF